MLALALVPACADDGQEPREDTAADTPSLRARIVWNTDVPKTGRSSPRLTDLTGDSIPDVVIGGGQERTEGSISVLNGADGQLVWRRLYYDEVYATALLMDVNADDVPDVIIGRRKLAGDLDCLDGRNGEELWTLAGTNPDEHIPKTHFNSCIPAPDLDGDGLPDLIGLQSGGRDRPDKPEKAKRLPARVWVLSSATGQLLHKYLTVDKLESYAVPALQQLPDGSHQLFLGTGGETLPGHVLCLDFPSFEERWRFASDTKGFVAGLLLHDFEGSGRNDVIATAFDGVLSRLHGETGEELWRMERPGFEVYSTPGLGRFDDSDDVLDLVLTLTEGTWPDYSSRAIIVWIDGATGEVLEERDYGVMASSSPAILDLDGDGLDEVVHATNLGFSPYPSKVQSALSIFDGGPGKRELLRREFNGWTAASPWIGDLDGNRRLDIVHAPFGSTMRLELKEPTQHRIFWNAYRGGFLDGIVPRR